MTPMKIKIALHYACSPTDYGGDERREAIADVVQQFVETGLLTENAEYIIGGDKPRFRGTDKLKAYVDALCEVPLPIQVWQVPDPV